MFRITRVTKTPASPIVIIVDGPASDPDGQFARAGRYAFYPPRSEDGPDSYQVTSHVAKAIMDDPGIAGHFISDPPWQALAAPQDSADARQAGKGGRKQKSGAEGESTSTAGD